MIHERINRRFGFSSVSASTFGEASRIFDLQATQGGVNLLSGNQLTAVTVISRRPSERFVRAPHFHRDFGGSGHRRRRWSNSRLP